MNAHFKCQIIKLPLKPKDEKNDFNTWTRYAEGYAEMGCHFLDR